MTDLSFRALVGVPMVETGDDLTEIIVTALKDNDLELEPGDILVVAQKIVSKAEGQLVRLADVEASADATALALRYSLKAAPPTISTTMVAAIQPYFLYSANSLSRRTSSETSSMK